MEATDRPGSIQAVIRATKAGRESLQSQKLRRILTDEEELRFGRTEIGEARAGRQVLQERKHGLCSLNLNPSAITTQVIWSKLLTSPSLSFLVCKMGISDSYRIKSPKYQERPKNMKVQCLLMAGTQ